MYNEHKVSTWFGVEGNLLHSPIFKGTKLSEVLEKKKLRPGVLNLSPI